MKSFFQDLKNINGAIDEINTIERLNIELETVIEEYEKTFKYNPKDTIEQNAKFYKHSIIKTNAVKKIKDIELSTQKIVDELIKN